MTAKQMIEYKQVAQKKIIKAIKLAEKKGAKIIGLGALTSSVTRGGIDICDKVSATVTTGHVYTTHIVSSTAMKAVEKMELDPQKIKIAVVGAAGSVGYSCALTLAKNGYCNFMLIDMEKKNKRLDELCEELKKIGKNIKMEKNHQIGNIKDSDIIISATNSPEAVIKPEDLKRGAIIVDDAQPSDISPEIKKERPDVLILDGGVVYTPGVSNHFDFGFAEKENNYCCLAEVMILAANDWLEKNCLGYTDIKNLETLRDAGKKMGFDVGCFQQGGEKYDEQKLTDFKKFLNNNK